jgi:hypothetical protein
MINMNTARNECPKLFSVAPTSLLLFILGGV